jgi:hypothetical protein
LEGTTQSNNRNQRVNGNASRNIITIEEISKPTFVDEQRNKIRNIF